MKILDFMDLPPVRAAFEQIKSVHDSEGIACLEEIEEGDPFTGGVGPQIRMRLHEMSWRDGETWRYEVLNEQGRTVISGVVKGTYPEAATQAGRHAWSYYI